MNVRLQQFLAAENISQAQFADSINVARASVSHILAGRNKPGFDFLSSMMRRYPTLNVDWLITGNGKMYKNGSETPQNSLFQAPVIPQPAQEPEDDDLLFPSQESTQAPQPVVEEMPAPAAAPAAPLLQETLKVAAANCSINQRKAKKIIIFYDDNTFQELQA